MEYRAVDVLVGVEYVLVAEVVPGHERTGDAVELPENAQLPHLEERPPSVVVDQHALEHVVEIVGLTGRELVVPRELAGIRVERQHAVRIQRRAVGLPRHPCPGLGLRRLAHSKLTWFNVLTRTGSGVFRSLKRIGPPSASLPTGPQP